MNNDTTNSSSGGVSRVVAWLLGLLFLVVLGFVSATAIRQNPLYSDRDAYGISKFKFIESCKEELSRPDDLTLSLQGQQVKLGEILQQSKQLKAGESTAVKPHATPAEIVSGVQEIEAGKLGLITPVLITAKNGSAERTLAQATMQCTRDKKDGKTEVVLGVTGA